LNNSKYYTIIKEIKENIANNGVTRDIVADFKTLRKIVVEENQPLLAKIIRLTYQHIDENGTFQVAIPDDEPIEDAEGNIIEIEKDEVAINPEDSLNYLLSIMLEPDNKMNISDIRAFVADLKEQAGEDW